jgi:hypothetical protein
MLVLCTFLLFWIRYITGTETTWNVATYVYMGKMILAGGIPYRDAFDVKGPGIYYLYALSMVLFGQTSLSMKILEAIWHGATALVLFRVGARIYQREAAGFLAAGFYLIFLLFLATRGGTAEPDRLIVLPMGLGVLLLLDAWEVDSFWNWTLAGLTMAAAALLKLPAALLGAAMMFVAVRQDPNRMGRIATRLAALGLGFLAPLLLCAFYFHLHGALQDLWTAQFKLAPQYLRSFSAWSSPKCLLRSFTDSTHFPLYAMGGLALRGVITRGCKAVNWPEGLLLLWLLVAALSLFLHGLFFPYHFVPLAAPLALLSAPEVIGWRQESLPRRLAVLTLVLLFLIMPALKLPPSLLRGWHPPSDELAFRKVWHELARSLQARTTTQDSVFLWANVPQFYLDADRNSPSRYFHSIYLATDWPGLGLREQYLAELSRHKPKFFAVDKAGPIGGPCPFSQVDYYQAFRGFTGLQQFLEAEYMLEQDTSRYTLYRRKDVPAPTAHHIQLGLEDDRLAVGGARVNRVGDLDGAQTVEASCGGCSFACGGANE